MNVVFLSLALFVPAAFAAVTKTAAICEYELNGKSGSAVLDLLRSESFGKPYQLNRVSGGLRPEAFAKLGLTKEALKSRRNELIAQIALQPQALHPIGLTLSSFFDGRLSTFSSAPFPDTSPLVWQDILLQKEELQASHEELVARHPLTSVDLNDPLLAPGFVTDEDPKGVRRFIAFDSPYRLIYGLDVPCDQLKNFSRFPRSQTDLLISPVVAFCRVPVLTFARPRVNM